MLGVRAQCSQGRQVHPAWLTPTAGGETGTGRLPAWLAPPLHRPHLPGRTGVPQRAVVGQRGEGRVAQLAADEEDDERHGEQQQEEEQQVGRQVGLGGRAVPHPARGSQLQRQSALRLDRGCQGQRTAYRRFGAARGVEHVAVHGPRGRRPRPGHLTSLCAARRRPALPWRALLFPLRVTDREPGACGVAGTAEPPGRRRSVASRAQLPSPRGGGPHGSELDGSAPATPGLFGFLAVATRGPESATRVYGRPLSSDPSSGELRAPGRPWAAAAAKAER